ncbi:MAG: hypothetical protein P1V18_02225 [Candidatus Gracilibacteria bacterium]|nr:hypothetical protein [Candidatus Gracilibacteria bacterium]
MEPLHIVTNPLGARDGYLKSFSDGPKRDKGQLFFEIDLPDNPGAEDALSEKIWRALHDTYYNCTSDDDFLCFEESLKKGNEVIEKEMAKRADGSLGRVHSIVVLIAEGSLHFSQTGMASVYLVRGGVINPISIPEESDDMIHFSDVLSGELADLDTVVVTSRPLTLPPEKLHDVFVNDDKMIQSELKTLSKGSEVEGIVSFFRFQESPAVLAEEMNELPQESDLDNTLAESEGGTIETQAEEEAAGSKLSSQKSLKSLAKHLNKDKIDAAKKAMQGVFSGIGSKFGGILKQPSRLKEVNRRYILLILILLVFGFGMIILFQSGFRQETQQAELYEGMLSQVRNNISIAEQRFLIGQKSDATEFLNKANGNLLEIKTAGFFLDDVAKMENEISLYRDNFDAIIRANEPNVLADLSAKGSADGLGFIHTEDDKNVVFEPSRVFETFLDKVQDPQSVDALDGDDLMIAGWELEDFKALPFITQKGQLVEYRMRDGSFELMNTLDTTWKKGVDIKTFHGEYVYLLDTANNTIWKYRRLRTNYSKPSPWTTDGDLSDAVSMAIDGDVYVLTRKGEIVRYSRGEVDDFKINDQPTVPLSNPSKIFTFAEALNIYVLDSENKRVVVYSKGTGSVGRYEKQILFEQFDANSIRDIFVDKDEQKLTILTEDKLYITDL